MSYYFFPSCKATAQYKEASRSAREYVNERFGIKPIGCYKHGRQNGYTSVGAALSRDFGLIEK